MKKRELEYIKTYLEMAQIWAKMSHCKRKKVGALIVKDKTIISDGYNGAPTGFKNSCEDKDNNTKWYVLHAEANAILKTASSTQSTKDADLYITTSPCKDCSKLIYQSGIKRVFYIEEYRNKEGLDFLEKSGIKVKKIKI